MLKNNTEFLEIENLNEISEISNNQFIQSTREQFLKNKPISACENCIKNEKANTTSARNELNQSFSEEVKKFDQDSNMKISYLDISFGNECNMQCPMCSPNYSSLWGKAVDTKFKNNSIDKKFYETKLFEEISKDLKLVLIQGGEPFMNKNHNLFLKKLIDNSSPKNITLDYVTNFSIPIRDETIELWKNFNEINLFISIEGVKEFYEITRPPQKWKKLKENLKQIQILTKNNINFKFKTVIQVLNINHLIEMIEELKEYSDFMPIVPQCSILNFPSYLSLESLEEKTLNKYIKEINDYLNNLSIKTFEEENNKNIKQILDLLDNINIKESENNELALKLKYFSLKYGLNYKEVLGSDFYNEIIKKDL